METLNNVITPSIGFVTITVPPWIPQSQLVFVVLFTLLIEYFSIRSSSIFFITLSENGNAATENIKIITIQIITRDRSSSKCPIIDCSFEFFAIFYCTTIYMTRTMLAIDELYESSPQDERLERR